jgi:hypothetical protein
VSEVFRLAVRVVWPARFGVMSKTDLFVGSPKKKFSVTSDFIELFQRSTSRGVGGLVQETKSDFKVLQRALPV